MPDDTLMKRSLQKNLDSHLEPYWARGRAKYAGFYGDTRFGLPTEGQINDLITAYTPPPYVNELFDCEDFAFEFKAHVARRVRLGETPFNSPPAIGIAWGRFWWVGGGDVYHACNWVYDAGRWFRWFEPQNKLFYTLDRCVEKKLVLLLV